MKSKSLGVDSRSTAETVTVIPEMDPDEVESIGTLNSMVTMAPVDGHGMTTPRLHERMFAKAPGNRVGWELCRQRKERNFRNFERGIGFDQYASILECTVPRHDVDVMVYGSP